MLGNDSLLETLMNAVDYSRYQTLHITRRGPPVNGVPSVLDIQMRADGPGGNGKLPTAGHEGHWELSEIWRDVGRDDSVRCAVLRGATPRAFVGGADLKELGALTPATAEAFIRSIHDVCAALRDFPAPVIACIEGYCIGGGLEIAAACDFRIARSDGQFGMPEVRVGVPSVIEAALLPGLSGWGRTRELLLRGHLIDGR